MAPTRTQPGTRMASPISVMADFTTHALPVMARTIRADMGRHGPPTGAAQWLAPMSWRVGDATPAPSRRGSTTSRPVTSLGPMSLWGTDNRPYTGGQELVRPGQSYVDSCDRGTTRPDSYAVTTACVRSRRPSLASTRLTWVLTVSSLTDEPRGDLRVGQALGDEPQHLGLAGRQRRRVRAGGASPARSQPGELARSAAGSRSGRAGPRRRRRPGRRRRAARPSRP